MPRMPRFWTRPYQQNYQWRRKASRGARTDWRRKEDWAMLSWQDTPQAARLRRAYRRGQVERCEPAAEPIAPKDDSSRASPQRSQHFVRPSSTRTLVLYDEAGKPCSTRRFASRPTPAVYMTLAGYLQTSGSSTRPSIDAERAQAETNNLTRKQTIAALHWTRAAAIRPDGCQKAGVVNKGI